MLLRIVSLLLLVASAAPGLAQQKDVTFFVIGKHANFEQTVTGNLEPVDFSFFSEIFLTTDGDARNAFLDLPTGERIRFRDQRLVDGPDKDNLLLISGARRFGSYAELQSWYPDGDYGIEFETPSGSLSNAVLGFPHNGLPKPPEISLWQNGKVVHDVVDPDADIEVRWTEFKEGGADENGILDDLVFAILEDETGRRVSHSGRPFEGKPYLTYADSSHTIVAAALQPGREYMLSVEHAILSDTQKFDSVPAMVTYAVTTKRKFSSKEDDTVAEGSMPTTDAQVVMFYYKSLDEADRFYGETLGLRKTLDEDWVKFYQTSATSTVGLVAEGEGAWHQVREKNAVMLSIVTQEVDAWYRNLKLKDDVVFLKEIGDGGFVRSFLVEDPGGYTVEFFQWLNKPEQ